VRRKVDQCIYSIEECGCFIYVALYVDDMFLIGNIMNAIKEVKKLKRSLYGLKKSPRMWYQKFDTYILSFGFVRSKVDHCIYSKEEGGCFIYVTLYVDDMLLIGNNMNAIKEVKKQLFSMFDMKDLDAAKFILGMEIKRDRADINLWLNQVKYIEKILKCFNMQDCKHVKVSIPVGESLIVEQCPRTREEIEDMERVPYASVVGSLMYVMVSTRPEISHAMEC
jgi:hypothetical protein